MSGTVDSLIATGIRPVNGLEFATQWQNLQNAEAQRQHELATIPLVQAQTGQTQAQTVGAQIQNELQHLNLQYRGAILSPFLGGAAGGTTAGGTSYAPQPQPGAMPGAGAGGNALAAASPGGAAPGGQGAANALAPGGQGGAPPMSPNGMMVPGVGVPLPRFQVMTALASPDPAKALGEAMAARRAYLAQLAGGATDVASWNANLGQAWQQGWITTQDYQQHYGQFDHQQAVVRSLASPEAQVGAQSAAMEHSLALGPGGYQPSAPAIAAQGMAEASKAAGKGQFETKDITVPDGVDGSGQPKFRVETVQVSQLPAFMQQNGGARESTAADLANPAIAISGSAFANRVAGHESGGRYGTANQSGPGGTPTSNAGGGLQFVPATWVDLVKTQAPDVAQSKTDQQIAALRFDASPAGVALQQQMGVAYARQNAASLAGNGLPVNALTLGLAHAFGPSGAATVLRAPPDTKITPALIGRAAFDANPQWQGRTVSQVEAEAFRSYGVNPVDLSQGAGASFGGAAVTPVPGTIAGAPVLTPTQAAQVEIGKQAALVPIDAAKTEQNARAGAYGDVSKAIIQAGAGVQPKLERLDVLQNAATEFRPGASAEERAAANHKMVDALQLVGVTPPDWLLNRTTGAEVIGKEGGYLAAEMTKALGSREAASVFNQIRGIQPNMTMSSGGFQAIINSIRQGVLRDRDIASFQERWLADPAHRQSVAGMVDAFNALHPVQAYASRVVPYPAPKDPKQLVPNTFYRAPNGTVGLWDGHGFHLGAQDTPPPIGAQAAGNP